MRGVGSAGRSSSTQPQPAQPIITAPPESQAPAANLVKVVVKVGRITSGSALTGHIASRNNQGVYTTTVQEVEIHRQTDVVQMGTVRDLKPGALLQVSGTSSEDGSGRKVINATEIVNLSGFVPEG
jgi:hypothetical protein